MSIFVILVVLGFIFQTLAVWGLPIPRLSAVAWLCWCIAALLWGFGENVSLR